MIAFDHLQFIEKYWIIRAFVGNEDEHACHKTLRLRHARKVIHDDRLLLLGITQMKQGIHPEYREVAFCDLSINKTFIIKSTAQTKETVEIDGVVYPLVKLDTSSESHPFYTGAQTRIVEAGRVEKFRAKYANLSKKA